jgi:alpha-ketoglutarate-dependent taurine dioxygenase
MHTHESHTRGAGVRRRPVDLSNFSPVRQRLLADDRPLPLVIEPVADQADLVGWIQSHRAELHQRIACHGGVLFRGFGLEEAADFERAAGAICRELYAEYGDLPREGVTENIYHSTPYPEDKAILYHNEGSHMHRWPGRINFFCLTVAKEGGATPIVDCRMVYRDLDPAVRDAFEQKGLRYVRNFCGLDVSWQRFFATEDRAAVEASCQRGGAVCEWRGDDWLRVTQDCRAVRMHPVTGEKTFFNQVQLHHPRTLDLDTRASMAAMFRPEEYPRSVCFGDGTPIDDAVMDHVGEIYERHAVRFQWEPFDLISLDNMLVAHARDPYVGPRKILVALGDVVNQ